MGRIVVLCYSRIPAIDDITCVLVDACFEILASLANILDMTYLAFYYIDDTFRSTVDGS